MNSVQMLSTLVVVGAFGMTLTLLWLQAAALRHTRHACFALLVIASLFGLAYLAMSTLRVLWVTSETARNVLFYLDAAALLLQIAFGLWGSAWLFLEFRRLHDYQVRNRSSA